MPPAEVQRPPLFEAFRAPPRRLSRLGLGIRLTLAAVLVVGIWVIAHSTHELLRVVTPRGIATLTLGMKSQQVGAQLGAPIAVDNESGQRCERYGWPNAEGRTFVVQTLCFEADVLVSVTEKRFLADRVEVPAPPNTPPSPELKR